MDTVLRAVRIGAFAGLAISAYAVGRSEAEWLLEPLFWGKESKRGDERKQGRINLSGSRTNAKLLLFSLDLNSLSLEELKKRYEDALGDRKSD